MWKKKQKQQNVFDEVSLRKGNLQCDLSAKLAYEDSDFFIQIWLKYVKKTPKYGLMLDVGCGNESVFEKIRTENLSNSFSLVGIDISRESVKISKRNNRDADFIVCDIDTLPLRDNIFAMVVLRNVLHHLSTLKPLGNLIGLLSFDGFLLIDDKIRGNPLQELVVWAYPLIPYNFKMILRENSDHIDRQGNLPPATYRTSKAYLKFVKEHLSGISILEVDYHGFLLVVGFLSYLYRFFPKLSKIPLPIQKLHSLEKYEILSWSAVSMTIVVERGSV
jgi:SAM-dependent methyltransferase